MGDFGLAVNNPEIQLGEHRVSVCLGSFSKATA
jgi:hypothetical protein